MTFRARLVGAALAGTLAAGASTLAGASAASAQAEPCVQRIAVVNNAAFVMSFSVQASNGLETANTDNYPINQSRTIDLTTTALPVGADVRPVVDAVAGATRTPSSFVSYCENGQTATYSVTGTTYDYSVTLIG
ncbi:MULTISPECIES: hypothetical protein [Micromonospora]|uniref:hypothetical protein n=1 Tax=Micromonospora TaxID=1873 RepID=UPI00140CE4EF|nr:MULTISPECIES: hypothetical protein [unclassified Micromonospora]NHO81020.1 hypothetical protein [Micromonospora sp. CMU55-4]WBB87738.1 hypothetical protein O7542_11490 [Micromonospora sp. WMMC264]